MRRSLAATSVFLLGALLATEAQAYVPPGPFLLRLLADRRREAKVSDLAAELESQRDGKAELLDERLYMKMPERMRIAAADDEGFVYVEREGSAATGKGKALSRQTTPVTDLFARLLFAKGDDIDVMATRMSMAMKQLGIDLDTVSLSRLEGEAAYVIGAKPWETDRPQLWLDKATLLPVRLLVYADGPKKGKKLETRYFEYGSAATGSWLPRVIEHYSDDKLVWRAEVTKVEVNQKLPDSLFDVPKS